MHEFPEWVRPGASFKFDMGKGNHNTGRKFHVRVIVDGLAVLREWSASKREWRYTTEPPHHFHLYSDAITEITQSKDCAAPVQGSGDLSFERGVLSRPQAYTHGAVQMAGEAVFTKLDSLVAGHVGSDEELPFSAGRKWPRNPFKKDLMKRQFAACIYCYFSRDKDLFRGDGSRHTGNGVANQFWWGFDGARKPHQWDSASKDTPAYASYRAGEMIAAYEKSLNMMTERRP